LHFILGVEQVCDNLRRELAVHGVSTEHRKKIASYITEHGMLLARVAFGEPHISYEMKILNTFLSLMILGEQAAGELGRTIHHEAALRGPSY